MTSAAAGGNCSLALPVEARPRGRRAPASFASLVVRVHFQLLGLAQYCPLTSDENLDLGRHLAPIDVDVSSMGMDANVPETETVKTANNLSGKSKWKSLLDQVAPRDQ